MKRFLFAIALLLSVVVCGHAQVNSQRVIFTGSNPPVACVPGKIYTNTGLNPAKEWVGTSTGACTPTNGSITGSGVSGQVAFWNGTSTLTGDTDMTFATDTLTVTKLVGTTINGNTFTTGTYTLTGVAGKTLTFNKSLTLEGTDSTTMTFPSTSATIARTDGANTFAAAQTVTAPSGTILTLKQTDSNDTGVVQAVLVNTDSGAVARNIAIIGATASGGNSGTVNIATYNAGSVANRFSIGPSGATSVAAGGSFSSPSYATTTNCSDSAGAAACGSAAAGSFVIDASSTSTVVSTTAVTANSQIFVQEDSSLGTRLSVTCNTQSSLTLGALRVTARTAATSFTVTLEVGPTTNPMCVNYWVVN